jgi:hypothetical protein
MVLARHFDASDDPFHRGEMQGIALLVEHEDHELDSAIRRI